MTRFCSYCRCEDCATGHENLTHAKTVNGDWICDVCWRYEVCVDACGSPCEDEKLRPVDCEHRPKLVSEWVRGTGKQRLVKLEAPFAWKLRLRLYLIADRWRAVLDRILL